MQRRVKAKATRQRIREIPYNYTSLSDREIVIRFLGENMWQLIEELRGSRRTGRSARMLFEVLGDMWVISRNPYLQDDLLTRKKRRTALMQALWHRLQQIRDRADDNNQALELLEAAKQAVERFEKQFTDDLALRRRIRRKLKGITRSDNIDFSGLARVSHCTDATDWRVEMPFVVLHPDHEDEVAPMVKTLVDLGLVIVPRGGGTGYTGSAVPLDRLSAIINTEKLETLSDIRRIPVDGCDQPVPVIEVGAGVVTKRVSDKARGEKLVFAVDPTSQDACTIGGNIAMNAGGKKAVLWGTTLDNLLSWRMVKPDGSWLEVTRLDHNLGRIHFQKTVKFRLQHYDSKGNESSGKTSELEIPGKLLRKDGLGKDVTDKFLSGLPGIQKEGCDGLITSARFILHRMPEYTRTVCLEFFGKDVTPSVNAIVRIKNYLDRKEGVVLSGLEHLDERYIKAIRYSTKAARADLPKMVLLADISGDDDKIVSSAASHTVKLANEIDGEGFVAVSPAARQRFWSDRARTAAISAHTNAFKINEDVVIPLPKLAEYSRGIEQINIELSINNKLRIIEAVLSTMAGFLGKRINDTEEDVNILKEKIRHAGARLEETRNRWRCLLEHMEDKAIDYVKLLALPEDKLRENDRLLDLLLRRDLRVSYRDEIVRLLDDIFTGQHLKPLRQQLRQVHGKIRNERLFIALHMHAGDGNVHTNIPVHSQNYGMMAEAKQVVDRIMVLAEDLGGVISGEHGIGITKIAYLEKDKLDKFLEYKHQVDPKQVFNRGKLMPGSGLQNAYTPSLQLVEQEALILENSDLGKLNDDIKHCLRCGKCKPECMTHVPRANLLYSPRNKILATGLLIEAFLYEEQTRRGLSLDHFEEMHDVADHCTVCHKCEPVCPVDIDFGDVTMLMRKILRDRGEAKTSLAGKAAMSLLNARDERWVHALRKLLVDGGFFGINLANKLFGKQAVLKRLKEQPPATSGRIPFHKRQVHLITRPVASPKNGQSSRQLLGIEDPDYVPILRDPTRLRDDSEAVFYFPGCGSERIYSEVGLATLDTLFRSGVQTVLPPGYLCCGYPQRAAGLEEKSQAISTENRVLFHRIANTLNYLDIKTVVVSCGTCMDQLLQYEFERIFPDCRLLDIHEYLMERDVVVSSDRQYIYHDPCHSPMKTYQPVAVVEKLLGAEVIDSGRCCGEAGTLASTRPDIANQLRFRKQEELEKNLADLSTGDQAPGLLTSCPACQQGLSRYQKESGMDPSYVVVELAKILGGENWQQQFIKRARNGGMEKVLL